MFSPPATPTIARIVAYCARRYNELNDRRQEEKSKAFMAIITMANTCQMESNDPELSLVSWLGGPHTPDLLPAVGEVIQIRQTGH